MNEPDKAGERFFQKARFLTTAAQWKDLPETRLEVAFAGRSNAGKSTAINTLVNQKRLAYASKTPGRTQQINFFQVEESGTLVDLPGYGYAEVPLAVKRHWQAFLSRYLADRQVLFGLVVLMDIRHPLTELDQQLLSWYQARQTPLLVLLSKADKLSRSEQFQTTQAVKKDINWDEDRVKVLAFSSVTRQGLMEARSCLMGWMGVKPIEVGSDVL